MPGAVSENCLAALRFSKNLNALLFRCLMNVSSRTRLRGDSGISKGTFALAGVYAAFFCSVMHHCVVRRSRSVPTEITEPPGGSIVQTRIHRNIAKQRLPGKPTDLRQFPDYSLPGAFFLGAKNHIENHATSETVWAQFFFWCGKFE